MEQDDFTRSLEHARNIYDWNDEGTCLYRKSDNKVIGKVIFHKGYRVAMDTSGQRNSKLGEYKDDESARRAVNVNFGLDLAEPASDDTSIKVRIETQQPTGPSNPSYVDDADGDIGD
jgi:hypothetical protein